MNGPGDRSSSVGRDNYGFIITGDGNSVSVPQDRVWHREIGSRSLQLGQHAQALGHFRKALEETPDDAQLYFLCAVAVLKGEKAFLASLSQVREAENMLRTAVDLEGRGIFFYFLAYLGLDYYERKGLRAPIPWLPLLKAAFDLGVERREIESLFNLLNVENPLPVPS